MSDKNLEEYLALPYRISLTPDEDEDGARGWVAEVDELPGCLTQGATPEEAVARAHDAMTAWLAVALEDGRQIPLPRASQPYSGRLLLRMPRTIHASLAHTAEAEGVSLNQLIVSMLSWALGERHVDDRVPA